MFSVSKAQCRGHGLIDAKSRCRQCWREDVVREMSESTRSSNASVNVFRGKVRLWHVQHRQGHICWMFGDIADVVATACWHVRSLTSRQCAEWLSMSMMMGDLMRRDRSPMRTRYPSSMKSGSVVDEHGWGDEKRPVADEYFVTHSSMNSDSVVDEHRWGDEKRPVADEDSSPTRRRTVIGRSSMRIGELLNVEFCGFAQVTKRLVIFSDVEMATRDSLCSDSSETRNLASAVPPWRCHQLPQLLQERTKRQGILASFQLSLASEGQTETVGVANISSGA